MMKKIVAIIMSTIVAIGAIVATIILYINSRPEKIIVDSMTNFVEELKKRDELSCLLKTLNGGSIEFNMSSVKEDDLEVFDADIEGKAYFSKDVVALKDLKVESKQGNLLANAYLSREFIYVSENEMIGKSYGMVKGNMAQDFENSIFAFGSGSDLAITNETLNTTIIDVLSSFDGSASTEEKHQKGSKKLSIKQVKELYEIVFENLDFEVQTETVKFGSENQDVRVISVELEDEDVEKIIKALLKFVKDDEQCKAFIKKYSEEVSSFLKSHFDLDDENLEEDLSKDAYQRAMQLLDLAIEKVDVKFSGEFDIEIIVAKRSSKLLKFAVAYERFNVFTLDLNGKGINDTNKITICTIGRELVYEVKEKNSNIFECELLNNDEKIFSFRYDKRANNYLMDVFRKKNDNLSVEGKLIKEDNNITVTCEVIKLKNRDGSEANIINNITTDVKILIKLTDEIPISPQKAKTDYKYDKITNITEQEVIKVTNFIDNIAL